MAKPACAAGCQSENTPSYGSWVALFGGSLLCSSCCVIQLVLNAFSFSCAGFAVLSPYKGAFRAVALIGAGSMLLRGRLPLRWRLLAVLLSLGVSFSEDILGAYNKGWANSSIGTAWNGKTRFCLLFYFRCHPLTASVPG